MSRNIYKRNMIFIEKQKLHYHNSLQATTGRYLSKQFLGRRPRCIFYLLKQEFLRIY